MGGGNVIIPYNNTKNLLLIQENQKFLSKLVFYTQKQFVLL